MNTTQPEALQLAECCEHGYPLSDEAIRAAAELRRQHARITALESQLAQRLDAADVATASAQGVRDGVASLTAQAADSVQEDAARVFTYKNQPCNNVTAWRFGEACRAAQPGGDPIDHGLSLLQKLQERGYGIVAIDAARKQGARHEHTRI